MRRPDRLSRIVAGFLAAAVLLTLFILSREIGGPGLPPPIDAWAYPAIQPLGRLLIGVWLLRAAQAARAS